MAFYGYRCDAVQGALVQEVAVRRPALKRSAYAQSMTVDPSTL